MSATQAAPHDRNGVPLSDRSTRRLLIELQRRAESGEVAAIEAMVRLAYTVKRKPKAAPAAAPARQ